MRKPLNETVRSRQRHRVKMRQREGRPFSAGSLKSNPDYYHRDPFIALALKFRLRGLPGLDIRQTAGFVSDPHDGLVGDPASPIFLLPSVVDVTPTVVNTAS